MQALFVDLKDYAGVAVGGFADFVFGGGTEDLGQLRWCELVIVSEPFRHVGSGVTEGIVERSIEAHGHNVRSGFHSRAKDVLSGDDIDRDSDVHGSFEGIPVEFSVALQRVPSPK